jgi:hypothetical protein
VLELGQVHQLLHWLEVLSREPLECSSWLENHQGPFQLEISTHEQVLEILMHTAQGEKSGNVSKIFEAIK